MACMRTCARCLLSTEFRRPLRRDGGRGAREERRRAQQQDQDAVARLGADPGGGAHVPHFRGIARLPSRLPATADGEWTIGSGLIFVHEKASASSSIELDEKHAIYRDVFQSTDATFLNGAGFVEEMLVLRDERAPRSFLWNVRLPPELKAARADGYGGLEFIDSRDRPILRMRQPFAIDSEGQRQPVSVNWNGRTIRLSISRAATRFPFY